MATLQVLLIDDDPRMEIVLREQVGLPARLLVRDPTGIFEPEAGKHGLVLLNAEFQKSFGLCRRFKKNREMAAVPVAFFTFSHHREHLRILADHRALPTHADHYLLPSITPERVLELLTKTIGSFTSESAAPAPKSSASAVALVAPLIGELDDLEAPDADDVDRGFDEVEPHESTSEDLSTPPPAPAPTKPPKASREEGSPARAKAEPPIDDDEFVQASDSGEVPLPASPLLAQFGGPSADVPVTQQEPSLGGFQADRMSSVERYVSKLHGEFVRMEDEIELTRAEREAERESLVAERDAAVAKAGRAAGLADENRRLVEENRRLADELADARGQGLDPGELERATGELAALRSELEWGRAEAEKAQAEIRRLRSEAERLLAESDRARGEAERYRTELGALAERVRRAEGALVEAKAAAQADAARAAATNAALEGRVARATNRLSSLAQTLAAARPSLAALVDLARELELEAPPDADGLPPGFDDH